MLSWLQQILEGLPGAVLNGLVLGVVVGLAAVGLTLVYGVLEIPTFAHGDTLTLGAFLGWALLATPDQAGAAPWIGTVVGALGLAAVVIMVLTDWISHRTAGLLAAFSVIALLPLGIYSSIGVAVLVLAAFGLVSHYALWRPLEERGAKMVMIMIASIGLAFFLRGIIQFVWGGGRRIYNLGIPDLYNTGFGATITTTEIRALALGLVGIAGVYLFLTRTQTGRMMRALADNPRLATLTGIDVPRLKRLTWGLGSALAGAGGVLYASVQPGLTPSTGWLLLLSIFAAVILGGVGSVAGTFLASLLIFLAQEVYVVVSTVTEDLLVNNVALFGQGVPLMGAEYKVAVGFGILILALLFRPQGLMGVDTR